MKKLRILLFLSAFVIAFSISAGDSFSGVDVHIGINAPLPVVVLPAPPAVVLIPGTYAYFVPDIDFDLVFYGGYWYRPHRGMWYRAGDYGGPWVHIDIGRVPNVLINLPPDYRHVPPGYERIPHGHLKSHWKQWEKDRHWDKHESKGWYKGEREHQKWEKREHKEYKEYKEHKKGKGKHRD